MRGPRKIALREFPGRVDADAGAPAAARRRDLRLRAHGGRLRRRARTRDSTSGCELLADWRARLLPPSGTADRNAAPDMHALPDQIFLALHDTIERFKLPVQLFDDLLDAFVQDVTTTRYSTWADVLDYCRRSANPVGRLVLRLSGYNDDELDRASDAVCTALQLTNFWQDLADRLAARAPVRAEEIWRRHGADPKTLQTGRMTPEWRAALRDCGGQDAIAVSGRPSGVRRRIGTAALRAARDVARRHADPGSARSVRLRRVHGPPQTRNRRRISDSVWNAAVARDTSFSYSFVVLPAEQRRAIGAVWDFCRAVDDAVDEAVDAATAAVEVDHVAGGGRPAVRIRAAADATGAQPQAVRGAVLAVAPAVRRSRRRRRDGSASLALRHLRRIDRLLPARRVGGGRDLHRGVRLPRFTLARVRLQSRPGAAGHQHHPRRQGAICSRAASTCRRKISRDSASRNRRSPPAR